MAQKPEYERMYVAAIIFAVIILLVNLYYYCHPLLSAVSLTAEDSVTLTIASPLRPATLWLYPGAGATPESASVLVDGTYLIDSSVEAITQNDDGTIAFNFVADYTGEAAVKTAKTIDLATVTEDCIIRDGSTLTGTLGANVKVCIENGATVMRKADLRAFVLSGETTKVWASGLTRFSRNPDSFVVNSRKNFATPTMQVLSSMTTMPPDPMIAPVACREA